MSTSLEALTDIADHVDAAFDAVSEHGGTVPVDKDLSKLAEAVGTIPVAVNEWGKLSFYSVCSVDYALDESQFPENCEVNSIDVSKLIPFLATQSSVSSPISFRYESGWDPETGEETPPTWKIGWSSDSGIAQEDMLATTGIDVVLQPATTTYATFYVSRTVSVDTTSSTESALITQEEYATLKSNDCKVGNRYIPKEAVTAFEFGTEPTSVPDNFLSSTPVETVDFTNATKLTTIGNNMLASTSANIDLVGFDKLAALTTIGNGFLSGNSAFNRRIDMPDSVTTMGHSFLYGASSFNSPIHFSTSLTGSLGLNRWTAFNLSLDLSQTHITTLVLNYLPLLTEQVTWPSTVTSLTLTALNKYNRPIDASGLTYLCVERMPLFNQPITMSSGLETCYLDVLETFNQPLIIPDTVTKTENGSSLYFLRSCPAFNSTIVLPSGLKTFGTYFLSGNTVFNQNLTLPPNLTRLGQQFMRGCDNMTSTIDFGNLPTSILYYAGTTLTTSSKTSNAYVNGVKITGANAAAWKRALPDVSSSSYGDYRKLIIV